ncbi:trypsin-like serine protease [Aureisphaera galaxeae]|uniref:S1 family peptidase n=1 Tax=Aureisphaera galaxeae TaxID=1538023 RepID=UPI00234FD21D|nr:trypsin-like serine protease [Aureisphaera galaxeae]MDC8002488.1 trypsin-like serine protease [Aureisphaera galaxeae]
MKIWVLTLFLGLMGSLPNMGVDASESKESNVPPIVIRHDKSDSEYIELGKQFPQVCKVGERGGDGTLIAPQWILTAGHVAEGMFRREGANLKVYFTHDGQAYEVDKVFVHPDFAPMQGNDIGLLLLKESVVDIEPASLYKSQDEQGKPIIIVGHGDFKTGEGGDWKVDGIKRAATNVIDETQTHRIVFDFDAPPLGTHLEGTAGRGDSGGPAFIEIDNKPLIAGISSAGMPGKNGPGTYGAVEHYTRVSAYIDWIEKVMGGPKSTQALTQEYLKKKDEMRSSGNRMVRRGGGNPQIRRAGGPLEGLGLMLMQDGDRIRIGGKANPLVPRAFRDVMFRPPSYLIALNEQEYASLEDFKKAFSKINKDAAFTIEFEIQGKKRRFSGRKM